jgi:hypothetical protein
MGTILRRRRFGFVQFAVTGMLGPPAKSDDEGAHQKGLAHAHEPSSSRTLSWFSAKNAVVVTPRTNTMTKYGRPETVTPPSET